MDRSPLVRCDRPALLHQMSTRCSSAAAKSARASACRQLLPVCLISACRARSQVLRVTAQDRQPCQHRAVATAPLACAESPMSAAKEATVASGKRCARSAAAALQRCLSRDEMTTLHWGGRQQQVRLLLGNINLGEQGAKCQTEFLWCRVSGYGAGRPVA